MTKAALSAMIRPLVEPRLPEWVEPLWFTSKEQALDFAPQAEIGWFDLNEKEPMIEIARAATNLKWLNSIYAGLDFMPLDILKERGVVVTNGVGINAITIAEYVVMLMLSHAKGYRDVVRAHLIARGFDRTQRPANWFPRQLCPYRQAIHPIKSSKASFSPPHWGRQKPHDRPVEF